MGMCHRIRISVGIKRGMIEKGKKIFYNLLNVWKWTVLCIWIQSWQKIDIITQKSATYKKTQNFMPIR